MKEKKDTPTTDSRNLGYLVKYNNIVKERSWAGKPMNVVDICQTFLFA